MKRLTRCRQVDRAERLGFALNVETVLRMRKILQMMSENADWVVLLSRVAKADYQAGWLRRVQQGSHLHPNLAAPARVQYKHFVFSPLSTTRRQQPLGQRSVRGRTEEHSQRSSNNVLGLEAEHAAEGPVDLVDHVRTLRAAHNLCNIFVRLNCIAMGWLADGLQLDETALKATKGWKPENDAATFTAPPELL
eukprot:CAMPEP_0113666354 /NCGR_PEP_ID=MMETSP0038_2-20120614/2827_1 /TAXON_ID=2898 /ORGANISM="Cryptomonas paramecium" /LENGTH=192 /DNA_ID=CAMNT_0000581835 /DNA_START=57 /DNA_END=637 /DNA_ORIENTATION=- /assembly_acc=CAM_ASM_000170